MISLQTGTIVTAALVFAIGLHGVLTKRDMIRVCVSISVMESAMVMALVGIAYVPGGTAPIIAAGFTSYVDPLPHALALTAIVIGAGVLAVALSLTVVMYRHYGTTDIAQVLEITRRSS